MSWCAFYSVFIFLLHKIITFKFPVIYKTNSSHCISYSVLLLSASIYFIMFRTVAFFSPFIHFFICFPLILTTRLHSFPTILHISCIFLTLFCIIRLHVPTLFHIFFNIFFVFFLILSGLSEYFATPSLNFSLSSSFSNIHFFFFFQPPL